MNSKSTKCPKCGVVNREGVWQWNDRACINSAYRLCPACKLIKQYKPASYLTLCPFSPKIKRASILKFIYTKTIQHLDAHPLERLMGVTESSDGTVVVSFTDHHSSERVGKQIKRQYGGLLVQAENSADGICRFSWSCSKENYHSSC